MLANSSEFSLIGRIIADLGVTGLLVLVLWKLGAQAMKTGGGWAGKFLEVATKQAGAMGELASAVKEETGEQREVVLAVRVLGQKVDEMRGWVRELDAHIREGNR